MQTTSNILMIEPILFGFNEETAKNNYFQQNDNTAEAQIQHNALTEFRSMVDMLRAHKVNVIVVKDTAEPHTPDSIFPNNWVSFHSCGRVVLYPMFAANRRTERRPEILDRIASEGFAIREKIDFTGYEHEEKFLEGTGSMILDRDNHIAYACLSQRTERNLFELFCREMEYTPVAFHSFQSVEGKRLPIYHTNVMMCVADRYVIICTDTIDDAAERKAVVDTIEKSGKNIIEISESQMRRFAGNMLQVNNTDGDKFLVMSDTAYRSLRPEQVATIEQYNKILHPAIPTIEHYGGGSARCMMAEIFLPKK